MNLVLQTFNETIEFLPGYEVKDHDNLIQFSDRAAALAFLHRIAAYLRDVGALRTLLAKEGNGINVFQLNDSQMLEVLADHLRYGRIKVRRTSKLGSPSATGMSSEQQYMTPREVEQLEKKRRGEGGLILPLKNNSSTDTEENSSKQQTNVQGLGFNDDENSDEKNKLEASVGDSNEEYVRVITISRKKYPESAKHIEDAQKNGKPNILTIYDQNGAKNNRKESLKGVKIEKGKDRDEYPPAMFQEGGKGASVRKITPRDNRGAGASIGNQCRNPPPKLEKGQKVKIILVDDYPPDFHP